MNFPDIYFISNFRHFVAAPHLHIYSIHNQILVTKRMLFYFLVYNHNKCRKGESVSIGKVNHVEVAKIRVGISIIE